MIFESNHRFATRYTVLQQDATVFESNHRFDITAIIKFFWKIFQMTFEPKPGELYIYYYYVVIDSDIIEFNALWIITKVSAHDVFVYTAATNYKAFQFQQISLATFATVQPDASWNIILLGRV